MMGDKPSSSKSKVSSFDFDVIDAVDEQDATLTDITRYDESGENRVRFSPIDDEFSNEDDHFAEMTSPGAPPPEAIDDRTPTNEIPNEELNFDDEFESIPIEIKGRFIGRGEQLATLRDIFLDVKKSNSLTFVTLIGKAGSGKGRLAREFARSVRAAFSNARVLLGDPCQGGRRYEAVSRAIAERIGIGKDDSEEDARAKIIQAVKESLPENQHPEIAPLIGHILGIPFDDDPIIEELQSTPRKLELRAYIAVRRLLQQDAATGPILLCFDGMEQASNDTVKLVHYLADGLQHHPVLILSTARPDIYRLQKQWSQGDFRAERIDLGPLTPHECEELLRDITHIEDMPEEVIQVAKTSLWGSPLAIESYARYLFESGIIREDNNGTYKIDLLRLSEKDLPQTHEEILGARLSRLSIAEQDLMEKSATIGNRFWLDATVALVRASSLTYADPDGPSLNEIAADGEKTRNTVSTMLSALSKRGLLVEQSQSTIIGEQEYQFAFAPLWEVAAERISPTIRNRYHLLIAQWLEARPGGRDEERQQEVARHLEAAGDLRGASFRYRRSADAARKRFANQKAIKLYHHALNCLGDTDLIARLHLWHDLGSVCQHLGDFDSALDAFERMVRLGWVIASRPKAAVAFNKMGRVWRQKGNLKLALDYLQRSIEMFTDAGDDRGIATSLDDIGQVYWMLGRYSKALDKSAKSLEMRRQIGDKRSIALSLSNIGNIEKNRGLFDEASACYNEALRLRQEIGDHYGEVVSLNALAALDYERGNFENAKRTWASALKEAERIGASPLSAALLNNLGEVATKLHKSNEARERLEQALALAAEIDDQRTYMDVLRNLALLELLDGNPERSRRYSRECLDLAQKARLPELIGKAHMALAEAQAQTLFDASATDDNGDAQKYFGEAISVFRDMGNEAELAKALRRFGEYLVEQGQIVNGSKHLKEAVSLFEKLGMPDAKTLEAVLSELDQTGP